MSSRPNTAPGAPSNADAAVDPRLREPPVLRHSMSYDLGSDATFIVSNTNPATWSRFNPPSSEMPSFGHKFSTSKGFGPNPSRASNEKASESDSENGPSYTTKALTKKQLHLFSAICDLQFSLLKDDGACESFSFALTQLLSLMNCEAGFIGRIVEGDPNNTGFDVPYVKLYSMTDLSTDPKSKSQYNLCMDRGLIFPEGDLLFGATLLQGKVALSNDVKKDPRCLKEGFPSDHPLAGYKEYLGLPFYAKRELVGMVGLANRRGVEFSMDDAVWLEPMMHSCGHAIVWLREREASAAMREQEKVQRSKLEYESNLNMNLSAKLNEEKQKTLEVLSSVIPTRLVDMENPHEIKARSYANVSVMFVDVVEFTQLAANYSPQSVLLMLNEVFGACDRVASKYDIEKIKTVGDCFMAVGGLAEDDNCHQERICTMAVELDHELKRLSTKLFVEETVQVRIGIACGRLSSGLIGKGKLSYDCWGDAVNVASIMESTCDPGAIQISSDMKRAVEHMFQIVPNGMVQVRCKGPENAFTLLGRRPPSQWVKSSTSVDTKTCNPETHECIHVEIDGQLTSEAHSFKNVQVSFPVPGGDVASPTDVHWMTNFIDGAIPVWEYSAIQQHVMVVSMFRYLNLPERFNIDPYKFDVFVTKVLKCYNDNPYHNSEHAIDITHTTFLFLQDPTVLKFLWPESILALMIASLCHDLNHPGQNNNHQKKACTPLIFMNSSASYLEEMHVVETFRILSHASSNILANMNGDERATVLRMIKSMILATDFALTHGDHLKRFEGILPIITDIRQGKVDIKDTVLAAEEGQQIVLNMLLKSSDVSNLVKPFPIAKEWAWRISAEFSKQGDMEREAGLKIDPGFDRRSEADVNVALGQFRFNRFLHSMWEKLAMAFPEFSMYVRLSDSNAVEWKELADRNEQITSPLAAIRAASRDSHSSNDDARVLDDSRQVQMIGTLASTMKAFGASLGKNLGDLANPPPTDTDKIFSDEMDG